MNPERKLKSEITSIVNVVAVYMVSGVLIMYGGINISFNVMEIFAGFYKGQWWLALGRRKPEGVPAATRSCCQVVAFFFCTVMH